MFSEFFQGRTELLVWPLIGLFLFLGAFLAVLYWVFIRSRGSSLDHVASLPLEGEDSPDEEARSEGGRS
jgi:cbb3-type cytochrome oxidase subunit 3